jgi:hypothetical protein
MIKPAIEEGLTSLGLSVGGTAAQYSKKKQERGTYKKTERKSSYMVYDTKLSGDKNMVPLKVAKKAVFFLSVQVLVPSQGQELVLIAVKDKNMSRFPIR